ncbi:MAG: type II secretion system F family protein [Candidatus Omnitrophota bacterium]
MPYFRYVIRDKDGRKKVAVEEAADKDSIIEKLQSQGKFVLKVSPATGTKTTGFKVQRTFKRSRIKLEDLVIFARQLSTMLNAGVTLLKSLDVISTQVESKRLSDTIQKVKLNLEKGASLSQALAKHPKVFNNFWVSLAEVGEASGTLPVVLERLADYMQQKADFERTILSAMLYPAILLVICIAALMVFSFMIIPKFNLIFGSMKMPMPALTDFVLKSFGFVRERFLFILGAIIALIVLIKNYTKTPIGRRQFESLLFNLPIMGKFYKDMYTERFTSHLSILVESGVPLLYALEITERMIDNATVAGIINKVKNSVREGKLVAQPMEESGFFPPMVVQMILIGEETGELGNMLKRVSDFYQSIIETFLKRFAIIFEPFMLVFMGIVIGTIVISMFLPIFDIVTMGGGRLH